MNRNKLFIGYILLIRVVEVLYSRKLEAEARKKGAVEHGKEHYKYVILLHLSYLISMYVEGGKKKNLNITALAFLVFLQVLRLKVIRSLGEYWNTKIIIMPDGKIVTDGIYKYMMHPNYRIVEAEMFVTPLVIGAYKTSVLFGLLNLYFLENVRIPAENKALGRASKK